MRVFAFFLYALLVVNAYARDGESSNHDCGLYEYYKEYRIWLFTYPNYSDIYKRTDARYLSDLAQTLSSDIPWYYKKMDIYEDLIALKVEATILRMVRSDMSIKKIESHWESCDEELGELLIRFDDGSGKITTQNLMFTRGNGFWLRRAPVLLDASAFYRGSVGSILEKIGKKD